MSISRDLDVLIKWIDSFPTENIRSIDRLAAALFVNCDEPEARFVAVFTAYFDASGNSGTQPYIIVSGYIANYGQWKYFEEAWSETHDFFSVNLPFHMAEFVAASENPRYKDQKNARADYIEIAKDPTRAKLFLKKLDAVQLCGVHCGISCIVPMKLYNEVNSILDLRTVVPPYAIGARMCIERLHQWERQFDIKHPVEFIFESGDFEQGKFTDLMVDEGQTPPIYKKKEDFAGLQAADQYAWEQYRFLSKDRRTSPLIVRDSFRWLLEGIPKLHTFPTLATLIDLCHKKGIEPRSNIIK